jgi:MbtH protein
MFEDNDDRPYCVVRNAEEQYSIWPAHRPLPAGWAAQGVTGTKAECLAYIERTWTDLRPLSARSSGPVQPR